MSYADGENVAIECVECGVVLVDADRVTMTKEED